MNNLSVTLLNIIIVIVIITLCIIIYITCLRMCYRSNIFYRFFSKSRNTVKYPRAQVTVLPITSHNIREVYVHEPVVIVE